MSDRDDDTLPADDVTPAIPALEAGGDPGFRDSGAAPTRRGGPALILSVLALAASGVALWQAHLASRGEENAEADLLQRLDALDTRITENERRGARYNELAGTLRDQLAESERLRQRLQEDLLALADRSARAEALIADLARDGASSQRSGEQDARQLLILAESRLRLSDDRNGAATALGLAEQALAHEQRFAGLRAAIGDTRRQVEALQRPPWHAVQAEIEGISEAFAGAIIETKAPTPRRDDGRGWWDRQFDRFDNLISIRREDEIAAAMPAGREGVASALQRARLSALGHDGAAVKVHLTAARAALAACCEGTDVQALLARLDPLLAIDWTSAPPDIALLRQRLDDSAPAVLLPAPDPMPPADRAGIEQESST